MSIEEVNRLLKLERGPLEKEMSAVQARLETIAKEIQRYVRAVGQGKLSVKYLEQAIFRLENEQRGLEKQLIQLSTRIEQIGIRDFNADLVQQNLQNFQQCFHALTPQEQTEALQCLLKNIEVYPEKFVLNVFELPELMVGSQKRKKWLGEKDSNPHRQNQNLPSYP